jgi:hypothetical protein
MRCEDLALRISQSADSTPEPSAESELAEHLRACPECRLDLQALREAEGVLSAAPLLAPPEGFGQRTMRAIAAERVRTAALQDPARRSPRTAAAAASAALLTVAAGTVVLGAGMAWSPEILSQLAVQSLILNVVQFLGFLVSVDAVVRAAAVLWGAVPAPAGVAVAGACSLAAFTVVAGWAWLVSRFGEAGRPAAA